MRSLIAAFICLFLAGCLGTDQVMSSADRQLMTSGTQRSLELNKSGESFNWSATQGGYRGTITPLETFHAASGRPCRRYQQTLTVAGETKLAEDTACRRADGHWQSINIPAPAGYASFMPRHRRGYRESYYDGGEPLWGLFYGLTVVGVHHGGRHRRIGHRGRPGLRGHHGHGSRYFFGHGIRIGG